MTTYCRRVHDLKIHPAAFRDVASGMKRAEVRRDDDRQFDVGDGLRLREYAPDSGYTGNEITVTVTHIQKGYGLPDNLAVLSVTVDRDE